MALNIAGLHGPEQIDHNIPHVRTDPTFASFGVTFANSQWYNGAALLVFYHKVAVPVWVVFFNAVPFMAVLELSGGLVAEPQNVTF